MSAVRCDTADECGHDCQHNVDHEPFANCDQRNFCRFADCVVQCVTEDEASDGG